MRLTVAALSLALLAAGPGLAEGRFALVLADSDYDALRDLKNPANDALAIGAGLQALGFEVTVEIDRDARRTRRALEDFAEDAAGADVALLYYAGHGVEIAGRNFLLPVDADAASVAALTGSAIPLDDLARALTGIAPTAILLVDACRDDPFAGTSLAGSGRSAKPIEGETPETGDKAPAVAPGFARVGRSDGLLYGFATAPGAVAQDGESTNSPYAEALLRHMAKPGLSLPTILTLVAQDVYDRTGNRQLPYFESALPELVFVTAPPDDLSERDALLLAMAGLTPELRAEVERIAAAQEVPLAPLYAAFLSADLASLTLTEREAQLTQAATDYRAFIAQVAALGEDDPRILGLRDEAAELMRLGAYGEAQAKYEQALTLGTARAASASEAAVAENLSVVETLKSSALAAQANLDHATAIARYRQIAETLGRVEALGLPAEAMLERTNALWTLGDLLSLTGDLTGAGAAYDEMRGVLTLRAIADPQNAGWQRDLSISWNKTGDIHLARGDLAGAETAYGDALEIRQALAARDPQNTGWQLDLSVIWNKIGDIRLARDDPAGAEAAYDEALRIAQALAARDPQNTDWQRNFSISWNKIGDIRLARGDLAGAEAAYGDALELRQALAARDPQNIEWQRDLSVSWNKVGDIRRGRGDPAGAEAAYGEALEIAQALAAHDPQNTDWQRDLAVIWERIGDMRWDRSDLAGAETAYLDALEIAQALAARDPQNTLWQRDLAVSWDQIGGIRRNRGDLAGAETAYGDALEIRQALAERDPQNSLWQRDLSISWERTGDMRRDRGDLAGAEKAYGDALGIRLALAARDPQNTLWQRDLSVSWNKIGDMRRDRGDPASAEKAYLEALRIAQALVAHDPQNTFWQRDLSICWNKIGDLRLARGDSAGAEAAYDEALQIRQALAGPGSGSVEAELDLVFSHIKLTQAAADSRPHLEAALAILERLQAEGRLPPPNAGWIDILRDALAAE